MLLSTIKPRRRSSLPCSSPQFSHPVAINTIKTATQTPALCDTATQETDIWSPILIMAATVSLTNNKHVTTCGRSGAYIWLTTSAIIYTLNHLLSEPWSERIMTQITVFRTLRILIGHCYCCYLLVTRRGRHVSRVTIIRHHAECGGGAVSHRVMLWSPVRKSISFNVDKRVRGLHLHDASRSKQSNHPLSEQTKWCPQVRCVIIFPLYYMF